MSMANLARAIVFSFAVMSATYALSADCGTPSTIAAATSVYDRTPLFSTRSGWTLGTIIAELPPGTSVRICGEDKVGIFFDKQLWYRINYNGGEYGWVPAGSFDVSDHRTDAHESGLGFLAGLLIPPAYSQDAPAAAEGLPSPGFSRSLLILLSFIFIILGILGKVTFDEIERSKPFGLREIVDFRKCLKGVVVSPIVFITFLAAGDFSFADEVAVVIFFCLAFQNGFFWQTVIPSSKEATTNR